MLIRLVAVEVGVVSGHVDVGTQRCAHGCREMGYSVGEGICQDGKSIEVEGDVGGCGK